MEKTIKIILSVLLALCLLDMPYGFYQLVRFVSMIAFVYLAYIKNSQGSKTEMVVYIVLALLFQPLIKISLGREIWNIVDIIVAIALVASIFFTSKPTTEKNEK